MSYRRAESVAEALDLLEEPDSAVLAGGTTLVDLMRVGVANPRRLVDVSGIEELHGVEPAAGGWRLGAGLTMTDAARHPVLSHTYPAFADALNLAASGQIRNQATLGGNLLQGPRCVFYRDPRSACSRRDPRDACSVHLAERAAHALFRDGTDCVAPYPGDLGVALVALGAEVELRSPDGVRRVAVDRLLDRDDPSTTPGRGEIITHLLIPEPLGPSAFVKRRERASFAFASASAAATCRIVDGQVHGVTVVIGAQSTRPRRSAAAEEAVTGRALDAATARAAGEAAVQAVPGRAQETAWCAATVAQALSTVRERSTR